MTEILSVHMGLYWTVLYIGLDEIVLDILYIQFPPKMQISHFFLWDFNYPVGLLGPVIYSLMKNRSIISPQRLVRTDDRSWIGGGVGGARDWPLWREITRGYTRGYYHQMPYETLGVSHFNGFFCQLLGILAEKKDVFFF
jgi:hypothetical protein